MTPAAPPPSSDESTVLRRESGIALTDQLAALFGQRIVAGLLAPGARLPSVRDAATRYGVSPHTVVAAYDQLLARGLIEARSQRGFYVRDLRTSAASQSASAPASEAVPAGVPNDEGTLIRTMFPAGVQLPEDEHTPTAMHQAPAMSSHHLGKPSPASGVLPPEWLDPSLLTRALRRAGSQDIEASGALYGSPKGDPLLRAMLVQHVEALGIQASAAQIVTTTGATHALDVVARTLLRPGDCALVDAPGWSVEYARLARMGVRLLPVPRSGDGIDLEALAQLAARHRPRVYSLVSVLHNPTGHSLSPVEAHRILQLAEAHDFLLVEDDSYAAFAPAHSPRLAALDGLQRTFYVTGFAKIVAPGWRVGCVICPPRWTDAVLDTKLIAGLNTPTPTERALALCLQQGWLRRHAEATRARLDAARSRCVRLARQHGLHLAAPPAGLFGWIETGVDTERLGQRLLDHGWLIAPGHLFYPERRTSTCMRINFAVSQEAAFWRCLADEIRALGAPSPSTSA